MTQLFIFCPHLSPSNGETPAESETPFHRPFTLFSPLHDSRFGCESFSAGELQNSVCVEESSFSIVAFHRAFHLDRRVHRGGVQFVLHAGGFGVFFGAVVLSGTLRFWVLRFRFCTTQFLPRNGPTPSSKANLSAAW